MSRYSKMPRKAKRDANEGPIIEALQRVGATVWAVSGAGVPDLIVGFRGQTFLIDVKNPDGRGKRTTEAQDTAWELWRGSPVGIALTIGEALEFIGAVEPEWRHES